MWYLTGIKSSTTPTVSPLPTRFLLGLDGGGSGTRARLADAAGRTLAFGQAGPSGLSQGVGQAWLHVQQAVAAAFSAAGLPLAPPAECAIGLGLAGVHAPALAEAFRADDPGYAHLVLDTDAATLLAGAHGGSRVWISPAYTGSVGEAPTKAEHTSVPPLCEVTHRSRLTSR